MKLNTLSTVHAAAQSKNLDWLIFWFLTFFAAALCLYHLDHLSLWTDEGFTAVVSGYKLLDLLKFEFSSGDPNPPLYCVLIHMFITTFGNSEFVLRLPSAIASAFSAGTLYLIGTKFVSRRVGFLATMMLFGSDFFIRFGQEARSYAVLGSLCLLSILHFPSKMKWPTKLSRRIFLTLTVIIPWVHAYGLFLIFAQCLYILFLLYSSKNEDFDFQASKKFLKTWYLEVLTATSPAIPWYLYYLVHSREAYGRISWIEQLKEPLFSKFLLTSLGRFHSSALYIYFLLFVASLIYFSLLAFKNRNFLSSLSSLLRSPALLIVFWILISFYLPMIIGEIWHPILVYRYLSSAAMGIPLLVLIPFKFFIQKFPFVFLAIFSFIAFNSFSNIKHYYKFFQKEEWRATIQKVSSFEKGPQKIIIYPNNFGGRTPGFYVQKLAATETIQIQYADGKQSLVEKILQEQSVWIVIDSENQKFELQQIESERIHLIQHFNLARIILNQYEVKPK